MQGRGFHEARADPEANRRDSRRRRYQLASRQKERTPVRGVATKNLVLTAEAGNRAMIRVLATDRRVAATAARNVKIQN